ncbi:MAG: nucleotidyltransferase family protein [Microthrixaceae bacterium]|jgi:hypothetical protein|nr:nucleotidyltransferase family protein [Microthrixaceae bacterium]
MTMLVDSDQSVDHGFGSQLEHLVATTAPMVQGGQSGGQPVDWSHLGVALVESVRVERLTGALMAASESGAVLLGEAQVDLLERHHLDALAWCMKLEDRLCDVSERLAVSGITDLRVVKGPAVAHLDELEPGLRTFGDLDLVVRGSDIDRTVEVLVAMGADRPYPQRRPGFDGRFAKSVTLTFSDHVEIDLHRTICDGVHAVRVPVERLFDDPVHFDLAGVTMSAPTRVVRVLHAAYHAMLGSPIPRLMSRRDLLGYLLSSEVEVDGVVSEAEAWNGTAVLHEAAASILSLPGVSLPRWKAWFDEVDPSPSERRIIMAQRRDGSSYGRSRLRVVSELPNWGDRWAYTAGVLFPSREHLSARDMNRSKLLQRGARRQRRDHGG